MVLTESDRYLIRALREEKKMSLNQILREFPGRHWKKSTVADFLKRLKATGSIERRPGSGRRRKVNCPEKVKTVQKLIRSKDDATGKNFSVRKIALLSGVSRAMVSKIASNDLGIKPVKKKVSVQSRLKQKAVKEKRLELCTSLLKRFSSKEAVKRIWFSGEKRFTVEKPDHVRTTEDTEQTQPDETDKSSQSKKLITSVKLFKSKKSKKDDVDNGHDDDDNDDGSGDEFQNPNTEVLNSSVEANSQHIPVSTNDKVPMSIEVEVVPMANVNHYSSNSDLATTNNDVMSLINTYVSNPLNFGSNPTPSYLSDQNSNYTNQPSNSYTEHSYVLASNQGPYPPPAATPNTVNYQPPNTYTLPRPTYGQQVTNSSSTTAVKTESSNTKNSQLISPAITHESNSVIVSIAVSIGGKSEPIFIEGASSNISSECYRREVLSRVLPCIKRKTPDFIFMQDRSPAHRSQNTVRFLQENCPDFIKPDEWPANCPQLNPVDYYVWKKLQSMVYHGELMKNVEELKDRISKSWNKISQKSIDAAISQFVSKLKTAINKAKD